MRDVFQKAMSLIWDIVQSIDKRAGTAVAAAHRRTGVSSRRELIFVGRSGSVSEQQPPPSHCANDSAGGKEQTPQDVHVSDAQCDNAGEQQKTDGLHDLKTASSAATEQLQPSSASTESAAARNTHVKKNVKFEDSVVPDESTMTSSVTRVEPSTVTHNGTAPDIAEDVLSKDS